MNPLQLAVDLGNMLDEIGVEYAVGGSVASSFFGEPRSTLDIDIALRGTEEELAKVVEHVAVDFYVPTAAAKHAIETQDSFNLLHHESGMKVDIFVLGDGLLDRRQIDRRIRVSLPMGELWLTSPEESVLRKLWWFRLTGETSERQWRDVIGVLRLSDIDKAELSLVAAELGVEELVDRAIAEASNA